MRDKLRRGSRSFLYLALGFTGGFFESVFISEMCRRSRLVGVANNLSVSSSGLKPQASSLFLNQRFFNLHAEVPSSRFSVSQHLIPNF